MDVLRRDSNNSGEITQGERERERERERAAASVEETQQVRECGNWETDLLANSYDVFSDY